jgi:two-component system response regulator RegA
MKSTARTILLVDDDDAFRGRLAEAMRRRGLEPLQACSVAEALTLLGNHTITDVVLDLRMPGEGGATLIAPLLRVHPAARIVVLTGFGSIPAAKEALRLGALDFLTKPADADQILAALDGEPVEADAESVPTLDQVEWDHIQRVLASTGNNISAAARLLGIDRRSLQRKLSKYSPH